MSSPEFPVPAQSVPSSACQRQTRRRTSLTMSRKRLLSCAWRHLNVFAWLSLGEKQGEFSAQLPVRREVWSYRVIVGGNVRTHRLVAELRHATKAAANWHRPLLTRCCQPVGGHEGRRSQEPAVFHVVVDERL